MASFARTNNGRPFKATKFTSVKTPKRGFLSFHALVNLLSRRFPGLSEKQLRSKAEEMMKTAYDKKLFKRPS